MKKILIVSHAMEIGGAERALLGLLDSIDYGEYQVDLFLLRHEGELLPYLNPKANLLPAIPAYTVLGRPMGQTMKEGHLLLTAARLLGRQAAKHYDKVHSLTNSAVAIEYSHKFTCPLMPQIQPETEYDLAVSFLTPHYFVAEKVRAKKKIAWIHTDYSVVKVNAKSEQKMWSAFDRIVSISENVSEAFCGVFPELEERLVLIENILPEKLIRHQIDEFCAEQEMFPISGGFRLLTIGRFSPPKKMDEIPEICKRLRASGGNVKWYLVGYGGDEPLIRQKIAEAGMEDYVIILGKKENPYPYFAACDLYVQPSRYEGKCVAVREAQMLCKPVVITNYATAPSQLEDGVDGVIVPMDIEGCAQGIAELLRDPERMRTLSENCRERDYSNSGEVEKLYRLI